MELKLAAACSFAASADVLIVPSGIETTFGDFAAGGELVLIVPSGIETLSVRMLQSSLTRINCT